MKIIIDEIESESFRSIGVAGLPSFFVHFRAPTFGGIARFVPASDSPNECRGRHFNVEIGQESVTDFFVLDLPRDAGVEPLAEAGSFRVCGVVSSVMTPLEPVGNRFAFVVAGEATFTLAPSDTGGTEPAVGASVAFIVQDMSLWDEAI